MKGQKIRSVLLACAGFHVFVMQSVSLKALNSGGGYEVDSGSLGAGGGGLMGGGEYASKGLAGQPVLPANLGVKQGGTYVSRAGFYNPPRFTYQRGQAAVFALPGTSSVLTLPGGAVGLDTFDIIINKDVMNSPLLSAPGEVATANSRLLVNYDEWYRPLAENIAETYVFNEQAPWTQHFAQSGTLGLSYKDDNGDGIIDGSNPPVRVETAGVWTLDRSRGMWVKTPPLYSDASARVITVPLGAPGVFALVGSADESVNGVYAYPVPFRPNAGSAGVGAGLTGTAAAGITFTNLPQRGKIEIYTLDGQLVRRISIPSNLSPAQLQWDVRNDAGEKVVSDTYIWRVNSGSNIKTGKLVVIW